MFENLNLLIILISLFWLGAFGFYMVISRQQKNIGDDLERLNKKLDADKKQE
ncbi:MAG: hypothetical protein DHS20C20_14230 [Ardenticatenaceae bacterium]|nr:MAG: hypothetical protein DHS20C20_14230 [Ardenticatenaceae bacterium]